MRLGWSWFHLQVLADGWRYVGIDFILGPVHLHACWDVTE